MVLSPPTAVLVLRTHRGQASSDATFLRRLFASEHADQSLETARPLDSAPLVEPILCNDVPNTCRAANQEGLHKTLKEAINVHRKRL